MIKFNKKNESDEYFYIFKKNNLNKYSKKIF